MAGFSNGRAATGARAMLKRDIDVIVVSTHVHEGPDTMGLWGPQMGVSGIDAFSRLVSGGGRQFGNAAPK